MARKKKSKAWKNTLNIVYGVGASIVILGALFKLEHYPGASVMLIIGMGVEAVVFFISAFDFPEGRLRLGACISCTR